MKPIFNPYLPSYEYLPDAEPHVFGDRLYVYGSHDAFGGDDFCVNDYVCWSAPVSDVSDWRYEGVIYRRDQDPQSPNGERKMQAPDVAQGPDGRYYLYYTLDLRGQVGTTSIAVCSTPAGAYEYYGQVAYADGHALGSCEGELLTFDPGLFVDDDGSVYMLTGIAPPNIGGLRKKVESKHRIADGGYLLELEPDMRTIKRRPVRLLDGCEATAGTPFEGHAFFEASSMTKINGRYYYIYSSEQSHELCYAVSDRPNGGFRFGGVLLSIGDVGLGGRERADAVNYLGNTHGGLFALNGKYYLSYHRQTNLIQYGRQGCIEPVCVLEDGSIPQVEVTSCGLNGSPLPGLGDYEARIACGLRSAEGVFAYTVFPSEAGIHPYFTQTGSDREERGDQYIANLTDGASACYKYFDMRDARHVAVVTRGDAQGTLEVLTEPNGAPVAMIALSPNNAWHVSEAPLKPLLGKQALYFTFHGTGCLDFLSFSLRPAISGKPEAEKPRKLFTAVDTQLGLAIAICLLLSRLFPALQIMTMCISVLLCMQGKPQLSVKMGINRLIITAIGGMMGVLATLASGVIGNEWLTLIVLVIGVLISVVGCRLTGVPDISCRIGGVTFILVSLTPNVASRLAFAGMRLLSTLAGAAVVVVIALGYAYLRKLDIGKPKNMARGA